MATLTGELISETYDSLLKVTDNNTITGIKKRITDGFGNSIPLQLSSTDLEIDGNLILSALTNLSTDPDKFLSIDALNKVGYRTGSQLLSDIGGASSSSISGTTGNIAKFTSIGAVGDSILDEIGNAIHLTNTGSSYASFGINNPGVDNDAYIGSTINNDFLIKVNNTEALRIDTAFRLTIANIQNATTDTDKFLVSDGGIVKYRTGTELRSDIGAGVGSVTSVALTMPVAFSVANSPIESSGTLAVTAVGTASQYIRGDGQLATLPTGGGGGSSVFYYLNGSVAASVATYKQMSNSAVIGAGTDFNLTGNGLIAQFLTDVGNPNRLLIPGGAWNFEMFFNMSSSGGSPKFYVELLKYDGTTFTSISSSSAVPETISGGTPTDLYLTSLAVPETVLLITDRLAVRVYIVDNSGGRTATLHTENGNLCQIITTFAGGISALNGLTSNTQYLAVGTSGTDFNISSLSETHTFNLPTASATNRGALSSANWSTFNAKQNAITLTTTGSSGAATLISDTLNIPNYTLSGLGGVPTTRTITINGTSQDLSANRTYSVGTVTSVAALTLGTSGTDLSSTVADGTTTPVITLNVPNASATARGVISTGTQTIAGAKTFNSNMIVEFGANTASALQVTSTNAGGRGLAVLATSTVEPFVVTQLGTGKLAVFNSSAGEKFTINNDGNLSNGTYTYTLPSATGTLALTSALTGYLPYLGATGAVNLGAFDLTVNTLTVGRGTGNISTNTAIGVAALSSNTTGGSNTASGYTALLSNTTGYNNTASGSLALFSNTTGLYNTATGYTALQNNTTGSNNTSLGYAAGSLISSGVSTNQTSNNSVYLGYDTRASADGNTNEIVIGYDGRGGGSNSATLGNSSIATTILHGNTSIGYTTNPSLYKLDVNGTGRFVSNLITSAGAGIVVGGSTFAFAPSSVRGCLHIAGSTDTVLSFGTNGNWDSYMYSSSAYVQIVSTPEFRFSVGGSYRLIISASTGAATFSNLAGTGSRAVLADANGLLSAPVSDISVKQNIQSIGYGLNEIVKMNPVWFEFVDDYKNFGEGRQNGNIAQEMKAIIPEAVFTTPSTGKMGINYDQLHAIYIKAIQELKAEIDILKNK